MIKLKDLSVGNSVRVTIKGDKPEVVSGKVLEVSNYMITIITIDSKGLFGIKNTLSKDIKLIERTRFKKRFKFFI